MGQNRKNMSGHFLVHGRWWTLVDAGGRWWTLWGTLFFKSHNNITNRSGTHTDNVFYVFCRKLTLVVGQNHVKHVRIKTCPWTRTWTLGRVFEKCSKIHKWCQETFRNSQQQCRVLGTMFGWGWKQFKQSIFHLRYTWSLTQILPNLALRKKWYYINLKGKTQGKGEKQGPSVENKPFLWLKSKK